MNIRHTFFATIVALLSGIASDQASIIDVAPLSVGDSGSFTTIGSSSNTPITDLIFGTLPSDSEITFTYKLTDFTGGNLSDLGAYANASGSGFSLSSFPGVPHKISSFDSLVLTTAHLGTATGTAVITNTSLGVANFFSLLTGELAKGGKLVVSYVVSAVPLPASALLFGLGLSMFAGFGMMKRKQQAQAAA